MSSRLETLQVARLAPQLLGESTALVEGFVRGQIDAGGGFLDRDGDPDLYYTVFGLDGLTALGVDVPAAAVAGYLRGFSDGEGLDLVHLACLAHCWAAVPGEDLEASRRAAVLERIADHRTADGGFGDRPARPGEPSEGNLYGTFLAVAAYDHLEAPLPDADRLADFLAAASRADGAYADGGEDGIPITTVTTAAVTLLRHLELPVHPRTGDWLLAQRHVQGGFLATPDAPMPDLLSTAVTLHALAGLEVDLAELTEPCLDFIDTLWTNRGAFHGNWADDETDCEYTFYGLLALGHLSVWAR